MTLPRRQLALRLALTALVIAVALGGPACGSKKKPTAPTGQTPFRDGTWIATATTTAVAGDPGCTPFTASFVDTFTVVGGQVADLIVPACEFVWVGTQFTQACSDTLEDSDTCLVVQTLIGSGSVTGSYFSASWTLTFTRTGGCHNWDPQPSCEYAITATGYRLPGPAPHIQVGSRRLRIHRPFHTPFERLRGTSRAASP